jgi:hypothetical protein
MSTGRWSCSLTPPDGSNIELTGVLAGPRAPGETESIVDVGGVLLSCSGSNVC